MPSEVQPGVQADVAEKPATRLNLGVRAMKEVVYLALTPEAARSAIELAKTTGCSVWAGLDANTAEEHRQLCSEGINYTLFNYPLTSADSDVVEDALSMVVEHHPNAIIWVQSIA